MNSLLLSQEVSDKFRFWSFISMVLLVFVHGYNLQIRYLQPWTVPGEPLSFTGFFEYFLANGIFRFRIPMLFIISGFLYAMHDYKPYRLRTGKRFRTLFLPYLIWSAIGLAGTWLLELNGWGRMIVSQSNVVRIDDTRVLLHEYRWYELLFRFLLNPVPYQLWFLHDLRPPHSRGGLSDRPRIAADSAHARLPDGHLYTPAPCGDYLLYPYRFFTAENIAGGLWRAYRREGNLDLRFTNQSVMPMK